MDCNNYITDEGRLQALQSDISSYGMFKNNPGSLGKSGHRGVAWKSREQKWEATFIWKNKYHYLGSFDDLDLAIQARDDCIKEFFQSEENARFLKEYGVNLKDDYNEKFNSIGKSVVMINRPIANIGISGCRGVRWHKCAKKWEARIGCGGKRYYLGLFSELEDAKNARKHAERLLFDERIEEFEKEFGKGAKTQS